MKYLLPIFLSVPNTARNRADFVQKAKNAFGEILYCLVGAALLSFGFVSLAILSSISK